MANRNVACLIAAGLLGTGLTAAATGLKAQATQVTVLATDPALQRRVSYADLNLAVKPDQRVLRHRIFKTAGELCIAINDQLDDDCRNFAVRGTRAQVKRAIIRAEQKLAGVAVGAPIAISMVIGIR